MPNSPLKIALWEASWELLARIWQEMADFILKIALWEASWELLARIWQEIADFTFQNALWEASWQLLARIWQEIAILVSFKNCSWELKLASLEPILASQKRH